MTLYDLTAVKRTLSAHIPQPITETTTRSSAVLIPLIPGPDGYEVLFELRAGTIDEQPGDICLPGGMTEPGETPAETALREASEELLIPQEAIQLLGPSDFLHSCNITVRAFAAEISGYTGSFNRDEVAEVFTVPLSFFRDSEPLCCRVELLPRPEEDFPYEKIRGGRDYRWRRQLQDTYFYEYRGRIIWGMTAKLMKAFAGLLFGK